MRRGKSGRSGRGAGLLQPAADFEGSIACLLTEAARTAIVWRPGRVCKADKESQYDVLTLPRLFVRLRRS